MSKVRKEDLPKEYQDIWDELIMPVDTNISFDSVILSKDNKEKYKTLIKELEYSEKLMSHGLRASNRLILYGASGTGKTYSLKALSNLIGYTMLYVDIAKSLTEGNVAMNISNVFKLGNYLGNCIIFLDECDSIVWNRDAASAEGGVIRRATNTIFQQLDQMRYDNIFACATNLFHRIDPAFIRRIDIKMEFRRPELDLDLAIRHFLYPRFSLIDDVNDTVREIVKRRAKQNIKLSYYEIEELVKTEMKRAVLNDSSIVRTSNIYDALSKSMNFKVKVGTADDKEEIFHNKLSTEPK